MENDGPKWAEQYLESINSKLNRVDAFLTQQYPAQCKETERRLTSLEIRIYIVCVTLWGGITYAPDVVRLIGG